MSEYLSKNNLIVPIIKQRLDLYSLKVVSIIILQKSKSSKSSPLAAAEAEAAVVTVRFYICSIFRKYIQRHVVISNHMIVTTMMYNMT